MSNVRRSRCAPGRPAHEYIVGIALTIGFDMMPVSSPAEEQAAATAKSRREARARLWRGHVQDRVPKYHCRRVVAIRSSDTCRDGTAERREKKRTLFSATESSEAKCPSGVDEPIREPGRPAQPPPCVSQTALVLHPRRKLRIMQRPATAASVARTSTDDVRDRLDADVLGGGRRGCTCPPGCPSVCQSRPGRLVLADRNDS